MFFGSFVLNRKRGKRGVWHATKAPWVGIKTYISRPGNPTAIVLNRNHFFYSCHFWVQFVCAYLFLKDPPVSTFILLHLTSNLKAVWSLKWIELNWHLYILNFAKSHFFICLLVYTISQKHALVYFVER